MGRTPRRSSPWMRGVSVAVTAVLLGLLRHPGCAALIPLIDGGRDIPVLYGGYFDTQIAKQVSSAVQRAVAAGKNNLEVNFPPVPNVDEVRFGTPLNQKFGKAVVARSLSVTGGYKPGSDLSRQLLAFANVHWAQQIAPALGGWGRQVVALSAEPVTHSQIRNTGALARTGPLRSRPAQDDNLRPSTAVIAINPGGEETWDRIRSNLGLKGPLLILNNAYSTTYGLGNKRGYEEAYYLKRISKGWVFRTFPGPWKAYLEKPDGSVELLQSYATKPELSQVATLVREESFRRYAIRNDRWTPGFGERL